MTRMNETPGDYSGAELRRISVAPKQVPPDLSDIRGVRGLSERPREVGAVTDEVREGIGFPTHRPNHLLYGPADLLPGDAGFDYRNCC